MNRHEKLSALLDMVMERQSVHVDDIVRELDVSAATARRYLDTLAQQQLITRTRGWATSRPGSSDVPLRYKSTRRADQKHRIARAAAAGVVPGQVVGMNGGTTTTEVAREIAVRPDLQGARDSERVVVVTNAVNIAYELTVRPHVRVVLTGGVPRALSYELTGPLATRILQDLSIDTLFLGVNALDVTAGTATHNEDEAGINAALVERAERVVVVADSTKLGRTAFARICPLERVDRLITDTEADPGIVARLQEAGLGVELV